MSRRPQTAVPTRFRNSMPTNPPRAPLSATDLQAAARALGAAGGGAGASRLLSLLYDPEVAVAQLLGCLNSEPALAARVLKVANSPYYRLSGSVGTLERAVQLLGLKAIRSIAAAGCLDRLTPPSAGRAFDPERFRRHSLAVACAAQGLSKLTGLGLDGEAFMAGLLHDIGILLLVKAAPQGMAAFVPDAGPDIAGALASECAHFGFTHEDCGAVIGQAWQLPDWLNTAVARHHGADPTTAAGGGLGALPALLCAADHVAHEAGYGLWPVCGLPPGDELLRALRISPEALRATSQGLPDALAAVAPAAAAG